MESEVSIFRKPLNEKTKKGRKLLLNQSIIQHFQSYLQFPKQKTIHENPKGIGQKKNGEFILDFSGIEKSLNQHLIQGIIKDSKWIAQSKQPSVINTNTSNDFAKFITLFMARVLVVKVFEDRINP